KRWRQRAIHDGPAVAEDIRGYDVARAEGAERCPGQRTISFPGFAEPVLSEVEGLTQATATVPRVAALPRADRLRGCRRRDDDLRPKGTRPAGLQAAPSAARRAAPRRAQRRRAASLRAVTGRVRKSPRRGSFAHRHRAMRRATPARNRAAPEPRAQPQLRAARR